LEEQVRRNMELFQQTFSMFKPFAAPRPAASPEPDANAETPKDSNIDDLRQQMKEMQERLERMSKKDE
jgi:polyhydroxyalkanoate synthesis regulator protein